MPVFPLGNVAQAAALVYGVARARLARRVAGATPRTGLAFCAGPLLAAVGLLALLPLAVQPCRSAWRRALHARVGVLAAAAVAGLAGHPLPLTDVAVGDLGVAGTERPTDVLHALGTVLERRARARDDGPRARDRRRRSSRAPRPAARGGSPGSARCQIALVLVWAPAIAATGIVLGTWLLCGILAAARISPRRPAAARRRHPAREERQLDSIEGGAPVRMSVLRAIESKIEGLFEGIFGRAFRTHVQPVELARKLAKEMDEHRSVSVSRVYVPNEYTIYLSTADRAQFASYEGSLVGELQEYLGEHARREGYALLTAARVLFADRRRPRDRRVRDRDARRPARGAGSRGRRPTPARRCRRRPSRPSRSRAEPPPPGRLRRCPPRPRRR